MVPSISVLSSPVAVLSHKNGIYLTWVGKLRQGVKSMPWVFSSLVPFQPQSLYGCLRMEAASHGGGNPPTPLYSSSLQCQALQ